jgi:hypothetical protein
MLLYTIALLKCANHLIILSLPTPWNYENRGVPYHFDIKFILPIKTLAKFHNIIETRKRTGIT